MHEIKVSSRSRNELIDITDDVYKAAAASEVVDGLCVVFVPHTTAAVTINEGADPAVQSDVLAELDKVIPWKDGYAHGEGNSAAHIKASLFGSSVTILVNDGHLVLGTWQAIYFCEFDGPRERKAYIKIMAY